MTYNKEILSRYAQQKRIRDRIDKSGRAAAKKGNVFGAFGAARKVVNLNKSMNKLGQDYVSPKPKSKKDYN